MAGPDDLGPADGLIQLTMLDLQLITDLARKTLRQASADVGDDVEKALKLVQGTGLIMTTLVDGLAVRFADHATIADPNTLYARASQVVANLGDAPAGVETASDPAYFARMQLCAANMLARLWLTGYLVGPIPVEAWPNELIARQLLTTIEQHADVITLQHEVEHFDDDQHT